MPSGLACLQDTGVRLWQMPFTLDIFWNLSLLRQEFEICQYQTSRHNNKFFPSVANYTSMAETQNLLSEKFTFFFLRKLKKNLVSCRMLLVRFIQYKKILQIGGFALCSPIFAQPWSLSDWFFYQFISSRCFTFTIIINWILHMPFLLGQFLYISSQSLLSKN